MANGYIPAQVERGGACDPVKMETSAFLGGVLGIDINGERQPIEDGIVDLSFVMDGTEAAAEQATASAAAAAESAQTASEAATSAQSSETAAQSAANAAEAAKADAEDAASSANSSKNTADSYATAAQSAAAAAQIADGNAERSAESAIAAAASAASSAGNAAQSANDAYTSASTAQAAADAAQTAQAAAEASEATASTAATTATQAKEAAQTAQTAAEAAQAAAEQSATNASGSATAAAGSATEAAASATAADASADAAAASAATFETDPTLSIAGKAADAKATGDELTNLKTALGNLYYNEDVIYPELGFRQFITKNDQWSVISNDGRFSQNIKIPNNSVVKLAVTANETNPATIAFLTSSTHVPQTTPSYCTGTGRIIIQAGTTQILDVPQSATYVYISRKVSTTDIREPASAVWIAKKDIGNMPLGLHEMPSSESVLNIVKRCRQLTDIKWTPVVDLARLMIVQRGGATIPDTAETEYYLGTFKAGTEYTGIPYGRVSDTVDEYGYSYGTVGQYIGFNSFISSVSNPKSRLALNNVYSLANHRSVIYASVCSGFVCYALNVNEVATADIPNIQNLTFIGKLNDNETLLSDNLIKIGDVLNLPNVHTAIITDIIRGTDGAIQHIEISEATIKGCSDRAYSDGQAGGLCIRKGWTKAQLFDANWWGNYNLYRYGGEVPYTPSPYVNVGDEFDSFRIVHFPIMPYEGEEFAYKTGHIPDNAVKLVIALDGYSYVKIFKNGSEISGSPFSVTKDVQDNINPINVTEIGTGAYTAYLCNISGGNVINLTTACHWTVTD